MMSPLLMLADSDLATLSAGLRAGRLAAPFPAVVIERLLGRAVRPEIPAALDEFHRAGFREEQMALALELVHQDRQQRPRLADAVDLVTSGPEARGITNRDTRVVVRQLFAHAQHSVLVAGYTVYQGQQVFEALAQRMLDVPTLAVRMFLDIQRPRGNTAAAGELVRRFSNRFRLRQRPPDHPLPQLFYDPRSVEPDADKRAALHAKCIVVDQQQVFVSSANFTEAAQQRNLEIGLFIESASLAEKLTRHFDTLLAERLLQAIPL
jgi:phosphatidylserine/phosphatidylglycerophosphate/cardiolipin synthase-like enzyme